MALHLEPNLAAIVEILLDLPFYHLTTELSLIWLVDCILDSIGAFVLMY